MKVTKDCLTLTNYEATALACRLRNQAQLAYIPEDPDFQPEEGEKARDLFEMAAQMIEAGGSIRAQGYVNVSQAKVVVKEITAEAAAKKRVG